MKIIVKYLLFMYEELINEKKYKLKIKYYKYIYSLWHNLQFVYSTDKFPIQFFILFIFFFLLDYMKINELLKESSFKYLFLLNIWS